MHVNVKYKNGTKFHSWINANRPFRNRALVQRLIHLFNLYVLFSQCRSYDILWRTVSFKFSLIHVHM